MTLESFCRLAGTFIEDVMKGFFLGCIVIAGGAIGLATASPQRGRLPQAAPSLSSQATEPFRLGPDGLQSTIAGGSHGAF